MSYEFDPITNELIDRDPSSNDLGKRLLNNITILSLSKNLKSVSSPLTTSLPLK